MRNTLAFILYHFYLPKIKKILKKEDALLSIYGHDPKGESVERAFKWLLKHGYEFISPDELSLYLDGKLNKKKPVWLSFDDGWKNNYYELLPILERYKIPATIFVATKGVEDGYNWINLARENRDSNLYNKIDELWKMPNSMRKELISKLPVYKGDRTMMNREELRKISESPYIYIANHTDDHVMYDNCAEEELKEEINNCEKKLVEITGKEIVKAFAYPNGNYNKKSIEVLKQLQYGFAATTKLDWVYSNTNRYEVPRFVLPDNASHYENILQMFGLWTPFFDGVKKLIGRKEKSK